MSSQLFAKPQQRRTIGLVIAATSLTGAIAYYGVSQFTPFGAKSNTPVTTSAQQPQVTALGRLEPETEVIRLAAPVALSSDRLAQLFVKEGSQVKQGQVVAVLDSQKRLQAEVSKARESIRIAAAKLDQVKAGAKTGEIQAQRSTITRLQAELENSLQERAANVARLQAEANIARTEYDRYRQLQDEGAISASSLDSKRLAAQTAAAQLTEAKAAQNRTAETLRAQIREAQATLSQIAEVRPVDVQAAQVEVDSAIADLNQAVTNLEQAYVRAPMSGQVIKIHTRPGEKLGDEGIADLGQTDRMVAVAEIYQSDIGKIRPGQRAIVTGQAFTGTLSGSVFEIGRQVSRQNVYSNEPGENLDQRVVEVKIRLTPEASKRVAGLTNLQVQTAIQL
jgi:HlyD family secretion protein